MSEPKKTLEFKDLSAFDLNLIKDLAVRQFVDTKATNAQDCLIEVVLDMVRAKGYDIVQSDREPTWSKLTEGHFIKAETYRNWWKEPK